MTALILTLLAVVAGEVTAAAATGGRPHRRPRHAARVNEAWRDGVHPERESLLP